MDWRELKARAHIKFYRVIRFCLLPILGVDMYCKIAWITRASARAGEAHAFLSDHRQGGIVRHS